MLLPSTEATPLGRRSARAAASQDVSAACAIPASGVLVLGDYDGNVELSEAGFPEWCPRSPGSRAPTRSACPEFNTSGMPKMLAQASAHAATGPSRLGPHPPASPRVDQCTAFD